MGININNYPELKEAIERENLVLFVSAGCSFTGLWHTEHFAFRSGQFLTSTKKRPLQIHSPPLDRQKLHLQRKYTYYCRFLNIFCSFDL